MISTTSLCAYKANIASKQGLLFKLVKTVSSFLENSDMTTAGD